MWYYHFNNLLFQRFVFIVKTISLLSFVIFAGSFCNKDSSSKPAVTVAAPFFATNFVSCSRTYEDRPICQTYKVSNETDKASIQKNCTQDKSSVGLSSGIFTEAACNQDQYVYVCQSNNLPRRVIDTNEFYSEERISNVCVRSINTNGGGSSSGSLVVQDTSVGSLDTPIALTVGTPKDGSFEGDTYKQYYSVSIEAGRDYVISVTPPNEGIYKVSVQTPKPNNIIINTTDATSIGPKMLSFAAIERGVYHILVERITGRGNYTIAVTTNTLMLNLSSATKSATDTKRFIENGVSSVTYEVRPITRNYHYTIRLVTDGPAYNVSLQSPGLSGSYTEVALTSQTNSLPNGGFERIITYTPTNLLHATNPHLLKIEKGDNSTGVYTLNVGETQLSANDNTVSYNFLTSSTHYYNLIITKALQKKYSLVVTPPNVIGASMTVSVNSVNAIGTETVIGSILTIPALVSLPAVERTFTLDIPETTASGLYRIKVVKGSGNTGNYSIRLVISTPTPLAINATGNCSNTPMVQCYTSNNTLDQWYQVTLDADFYSFNLTEFNTAVGYRIYLYRADNTTDPYASDSATFKSNLNFAYDHTFVKNVAGQYLNSLGVALTVNSDGSISGEPAPTRPTTYYIRVKPQSSNTGRYTLSVKPTEELVLNTDKEYSFTKTLGNLEEVWYRFVPNIDVAQPDTLYQFTAEHPTNVGGDFSAGTDIDIYIYSAQNTNHSAFLTSSANTGVAKEQMYFRPNTNNHYFIKVRKKSISNATTVRLRATTTNRIETLDLASTSSVTYRWGTVANNNIVDNNIDPNKWYQVTLPGNKHYSIELSVPKEYNTLANYDLSLYNSSGDILSSPGLIQRQDETIVYSTPTDATRAYKIRVSNTNNVNGEFTLKILDQSTSIQTLAKPLPADYNANAEPTPVVSTTTFTTTPRANDTPANSPAMQYNTSSTQWYSMALDAVTYRFSADTSDGSNVNSAVNTSNAINMYVYRFDNCGTRGCVRYALLDSTAKYTAGTSYAVINFLASIPATYWVRVQKVSTGNVSTTFKASTPTVRVFDAIPNTSAGLAKTTTITPSTAIGQEHWFSVNLQRGVTYDVILDVKLDDQDLFLYSPNNGVVADSTSDVPGRDESITYKATIDGTYLIKVLTNSTDFTQDASGNRINHSYELRVKQRFGAQSIPWSSLDITLYRNDSYEYPGFYGNNSTNTLNCDATNTTNREIWYKLSIPSNKTGVRYTELTTIPGAAIDMSIYREGEQAHIFDTKQTNPTNFGNIDTVGATESFFHRNVPVFLTIFHAVENTAKYAGLDALGTSSSSNSDTWKYFPYNMDSKIFKFDINSIRTHYNIPSDQSLNLDVKFYCHGNYARYQAGTATAKEYETYDKRGIPAYRLRFFDANPFLDLNDATYGGSYRSGGVQNYFTPNSNLNSIYDYKGYYACVSPNIQFSTLNCNPATSRNVSAGLNGFKLLDLK